MERIRLAVCLFALLLASVSYAQWSSDPAVNLTVADAAGDQVQPKVAPTSDGGCYISWFDALGNGFDVRVQKLDVEGNEVFSHNGVLVADRGFTSTQDYGLDVDAAGNALLVFRDDRPGGIQITAAKVSTTGSLPWGAAGVQLTSTSAFVAAPKIAGTADGGVVVAWTQDSDVHLQKLNPDGSQAWGADVVITPVTGSYSASDLHDAGTDVILAIVHQIGGFTSPKHLVAQKFDAMGASLWGSAPIAIFDAGSLQFGNYPTFVPDGSGGAVFSWYDTSSLQLQCYVQHVLSNGTEAFPHNGAAVSINAARVRVSPSAAYSASTDEVFAFWEEESADQSQSGVYGQKFDSVGDRQWGSSGAVVVPVGSDENTQVRCLSAGTGAFVFWVQASAVGQDQLFGARLDSVGTMDVATFDVASTPSDKSRLVVGQGASGFAILTWQDARNDAGDIMAQNVNADGSLGTPWMGAADDTGARPVLLSRAWPNPMQASTSVEYSMPASRAPVFEVFDLTGRVVRREPLGPGAGHGVVSWDGRDGAGRRAPSGVYFLRVLDGELSDTEKVVLVR